MLSRDDSMLKTSLANVTMNRFGSYVRMGTTCSADVCVVAFCRTTCTKEFVLSLYTRESAFTTPQQNSQPSSI